MESKKVFRSRISVLLIGFFLLVFILTGIPMINQMIISGLCIMCGTLVFIGLLLSGMHYIISGNNLYVKILWIIPFGLFGSVKISNIISIERSYNPLSSPAASLKRLRLDLVKEAKFLPFMLISPVREQEFIEELKAINPDIYVNVPVKTRIWRIQDWDI